MDTRFHQSSFQCRSTAFTQLPVHETTIPGVTLDVLFTNPDIPIQTKSMSPLPLTPGVLVPLSLASNITTPCCAYGTGGIDTEIPRGRRGRELPANEHPIPQSEWIGVQLFPGTSVMSLLTLGC